MFLSRLLNIKSRNNKTAFLYQQQWHNNDHWNLHCIYSRHHSKLFMYISTFNIYHKPTMWVLLLCSFHILRNKSGEQLSNLPKVTQIINSRSRIRNLKSMILRNKSNKAWKHLWRKVTKFSGKTLMNIQKKRRDVQCSKTGGLYCKDVNYLLSDLQSQCNPMKTPIAFFFLRTWQAHSKIHR